MEGIVCVRLWPPDVQQDSHGVVVALVYGVNEVMQQFSVRQVATPGNLFRFFRELVLKDGWSIERALPLLTRNPANVLKLKKKGEV